MNTISIIILVLFIPIFIVWAILIKEWWDDSKNKRLKEVLLDIIKPEDDITGTLVKYSFFGGIIYFIYFLFHLLAK